MSKKRKMSDKEDLCECLRVGLLEDVNDELQDMQKQMKFGKIFFDELKVGKPFPANSAMALFLRDAEIKTTMKAFCITQCFQRAFTRISMSKNWTCGSLKDTDAIRLVNSAHHLHDNSGIYILMFMFRQNPRDLRCHKQLRQFATEMQKDGLDGDEFDVDNAAVLFNRLLTPLVQSTLVKIIKASKK